MARYFNGNPDFFSVHVKGEVSEKYVSPNGHLYFKLKDKSSRVPCIVYRDNIKNIQFDIENGMKLLVIAKIGIYWPHGKYQLDVRSATEDGLGQLYVKLQQLRKRLEKEGLFDPTHKKELPHFVKRIGVITSKGGSVIHDILKTVKQKWPYCQVILFPAAVQGTSSKNEILTQISRADNTNMDVLIVARGGGSIQDLWSYNEEEVVRVIFNCRTPVITAIGHEDDTTLSDLVADRRASTPTMAASLAVEDRNSILENIGHYNSRLISFMSSKMDSYRKQMDFMLSRPIFVDKTFVYKSKKHDFDDLSKRFGLTSWQLVNSKRVALEKITNEYVIRQPCKMQLDISKANLNELRNRLIDSMNKILNDNRVDVDDVTNRFKFSSQKLVTSRRHELEIAESFIMSKPCQRQIELSRNNLNVVQDKLIRNVGDHIEDNRKNLNTVSNDFKNRSKDLVNSNRVALDKIINEYVIRHPCKMQLDILNANLNGYQNRLVEATSSTLISNRANLDNAKDKFKFSSQKLLTSKKHDLELVKSNFSANFYSNQISASRNNLYMVQEKLMGQMDMKLEKDKMELELIRNQKVIKNPYLILDSHKSELGIYKEKLDNIKQVIELKKEQQKQNQRYMIIIALIVVVMVIVLLIMFGGIL